MPPTITHPPGKVHTHTVIFLHGRCDTARNFASSFQDSVDSKGFDLLVSYRTTRWVFPEADMRPRAPPAFPGEEAPQWFEVHNSRDYTENEERQMPGLKQSVVRLRRIILSEGSILKGRFDRIMLGGINQGAAAAIHTLLNLELPVVPDASGGRQRLGGYIGISCRMSFAGRTLAETRQVLGLEDVPEDDALVRSTPMLLQHCVNDEVVDIGHGRATRDAAQLLGADVTWKEFARGAHWMNSPSGIDDIKEFVKRAADLAMGPSILF